jgi:hypothetical protein
VKQVFAVALGILTAIGGFVDIGDLVANGLVGARFGLTLAWATVLGVIGICVFAEMSGRVAAVSGRATFDLVRERLGPRVGLANLGASLLVTMLTFGAEVGGIALSLAGHERELPAVGAGRRAGGVAGDVAGEVLDPGERHRPARPEPRRVPPARRWC